MKKLKVMTVVGTRPEIIRLACVLKKLDASPAIEHVLVHTGQNYDYELNEVFFEDLWPDAVWGFGFKPSRWKAALLNAFVRFIYARCDRIAVSCRRYVKRIKELTGRDAEWIPQWEPAEMELPEKRAGGKTVFMFAGNMGVPQNLENVIAGFEKAQVKDSELWLVGGGVMFEPLKKKFGTLDNVKFCGRQPRADMPKWFAQADALIISLTDKYCLTLPGKFQSYIKTGKPLLGILSGEAKDLIDEFEIGCSSSPDDINGIVAAYQSMAEMLNDGRARECGRRAKALSHKMFNRERLIASLSDNSEPMLTANYPQASIPYPLPTKH